MMGERKGVVNWGVVAGRSTRVVLSQNADQFGDRIRNSKRISYHSFPRGLNCRLGARSVMCRSVSANYNNWTLLRTALATRVSAPSPRIRDEKDRKDRNMHFHFEHRAALFRWMR
jgi:hypothetical protein